LKLTPSSPVTRLELTKKDCSFEAGSEDLAHTKFAPFIKSKLGPLRNYHHCDSATGCFPQKASIAWPCHTLKISGISKVTYCLSKTYLITYFASDCASEIPKLSSFAAVLYGMSIAPVLVLAYLHQGQGPARLKILSRELELKRKETGELIIR
jgi:hypothetical protein